MAYIVTEPCVGVKDRSCVEVCPVDCFFHHPNIEAEYDEKKDPPAAEVSLNNQGKKQGMLIIDPEECINCGACEPECPVNAIYEDETLPDEFQHYLDINEEVVNWDSSVKDEMNVVTKDDPLPMSSSLKEN